MAKTSFDGKYTGDKAHYTSDRPYVSGHLKGGYVFPLAEKAGLDVYGRYAATWLDGDTVRLHDKADTRFRMSSTITHALRGGLRFKDEESQARQWKAGLAYEHIFNGDAKGYIDGMNLEVPSLDGDTVIAEAGMTFKPSGNNPWTFDMTAKGYIGDREGWMGNVMVSYQF